ncbi:MAG: glycosyltransferase family 4 protein [Deltaproteobacteria bacterium]|nr:glycosyltransferase family 4 protein [Deltaproteobacteria bacterium]
MIGVVTTSYPRWPGDPAGHFVAAHVAYLRATGAEVEVIAADDPQAIAQPGVIRVPAPAGLFYAGGAPDALEAGARGAARFAAALTAAVLRRSHRWRAVCAHWWLPSGLAAIASRGPLLVIAHGGDLHLARRLRLLAPVTAALLARRARFAFVAEDLRRAALAALPPGLARRLDRAAIIEPMGIDRGAFAALPRAPTSPPTIAVLARLVPIKGVDVAIAAMAHVRTPCRLVIAGDGPLRAALATADPRVVFAGALDTGARDRLLAEASALVIPSRALATGRAEGLPLAALEGMAAGVPVIASAVGGLAELPGSAITHVPPEDPAALAVAIEHVLQGAIDTRAAAARFIEDRDWRAVGARLDAHWRR